MLSSGRREIPGRRLVEVELPGDLYEHLLLASAVSGRTLNDLIVDLLATEASIAEIRRPGSQEWPG
jgi:hypothetical protein